MLRQKSPIYSNSVFYRPASKSKYQQFNIENPCLWHRLLQFWAARRKPLNGYKLSRLASGRLKPIVNIVPPLVQKHANIKAKMSCHTYLMHVNAWICFSWPLYSAPIALLSRNGMFFRCLHLNSSSNLSACEDM